MNQRLKGRRIAALAADGFVKVELVVPMKALKAAGAEVDVISLRDGKIRGVNLHEPTRQQRSALFGRYQHPLLKTLEPLADFSGHLRHAIDDLAARDGDGQLRRDGEATEFAVRRGGDRRRLLGFGVGDAGGDALDVTGDVAAFHRQRAAVARHCANGVFSDLLDPLRSHRRACSRIR